MGGHKKKLRSEKAKIKLKGAKLPKGLNVTKTDFKVRKITIREQLSAQYEDGQKQINIKEIITRLKHSSSSFRLEALRNLRAAIASNCFDLLKHLSEIVQGISAICLDMDRETRRESYKTLGNLLSALPVDSVAPFFQIISSYLRCAMTHIQPALQEDALLMLDVLLQHVPQLVATHSSKIFQNFLEMISRVRVEGDRANRTLTVHMGQKQTTVRWRSKVLQRLQQMLHTLAEYKRTANNFTMSDKSLSRIHTFSTKVSRFYPLKRIVTTTNHQMNDQISAVFNRSNEQMSNGVAGFNGSPSISDESFILRGYIEHLIPLLLESWLEVRPAKRNSVSSSQILLTQDAAYTLHVVLEIFKSLWCLVQLHEQEVKNHDLSDWLRKQYGESFATYFLQDGFPYQQVEAEHSSKKSKKLLQADSQLCLQQNVNLSYLMCCFNTEKMHLHSPIFLELLHYLTNIVQQLRDQTFECPLNLEVSLRAFMLQNGENMLDLHGEAMQKLFRETVKSFLQNRFPHKNGIAAKVLVLLCEIVQHRRLVNAYGEDEFKAFLEFLPQLLLRATITNGALIAMSELGKQKNGIFLRALEKTIVPVVENISNIQVVGAHNTFEGKKHIMNLFYWTEKRWTIDETDLLTKKIDQHVTDKRFVSYFKFVLS